METVNTVVVGSGPAGLAVARCLGDRGVETVVLEAGDTVAPAWHNHYERLHLHTHKSGSGLPGQSMPATYPKYPSRDQFADYLAAYADEAGIDVRLSNEVSRVTHSNGSWLVETSDGATLETGSVVVATGLNHVPTVPEYEGQETFEGEIVHSASYRNGEPYRGKRVLVVGFGNSAGEIALDLMEHGATVCISVRSPSVVVPREIMGIPITTVARFLSLFPPKIADGVSKAILGLLVGDVSELGIPIADWGPMEQITRKGKVPMLDVGTMAALRSGDIEARP